MNGTNEEPASTPPPDNLRSLTPEQLAELVSNPKVRGRVWAEVHRRLKDDPRKANFFTFRWFLPADEEDKAKAFDGLMACCWEATKRRMPYGLFPRGYAETKQRDGYREGGIKQETHEAIKTALVDCLYGLRTLSPPEIVLTTLNGGCGFRTDAWVGNALRRKVRAESPYLNQYGNDVITKGGYATLFEVLPDNPGPRTNLTDHTNFYNEAVEMILQEKAQIIEDLGEEGWEVLEEIIEHEDQGMFPKTKRDRQRVLTEVFQTAYSVREVQARTHKRRFLAAVEASANEGKPVFEWIAELLALLGCWDGEKS